MTGRTQQLMNHAARLLDMRGDIAGAENALREAIRLSESQSDWVMQARAAAFLGEVLAGIDRAEEAVPLFESVLNLATQPGHDGCEIDHELRTAREHLARARGLG